ncbi:hypothetical protein RsoM2USA_14 [Ralstonia phage RsoM2USA]|nr:hypothetical protein RsoM2USA_14 [Ralstonia phage RsoM2USA]
MSHTELNNLLLNTDSYKASHFLQYPEGTERVFSYIESRGGEYDATVFFGLQMFIKQYLTNPITMDQVEEAKLLWEAHGEPFNYEGWKYIVNELGGKLPVEIKAVPEGSVIPTKNVLVTIENTDPKCFWLTSYLETALLRAVWYPTTVATQSYECKKIIAKYLEETGDVSGISFKLHDFGARGVSSFESAGIGGLGHLINFMGTDTMTAILFARKYYNVKDMPAFSIPAAEHSTTTAGGREGEVAQFKRCVDAFAKPGAIYAVVSDGYDIFNACENIWGKELKTQVVDSGATLVIRPDSGDPETTVMKCLNILAKQFGTTTNDKGYRVLNNVRLIQGDGVNIRSIRAILANMELNGFSADNIAFGMGGALLQGINRDTLKFAMKCSWMQVNGEGRDIFKDPITDQGKKSKKGRLKLVRETMNGEYRTMREEEFIKTPTETVLEVVYRNGELLRDMTFEEVRANASK